MFSIFYLGLPNIMPLGDLGFINAYKKLYKDQNLTKLSFILTNGEIIQLL